VRLTLTRGCTGEGSPDTPSACSRVSVRLWALLGAAAILASGATVLGFLGRLWWAFELVSHFRAQYCLMLMGSACLYLLGGKRRAAMRASIFTFINLSVIVPLYLGTPPTHAEGRTFRAVLVNVNTANREHERLRHFIRTEKPDFMVLLEINQRWLAALQELRALYPYSRAALRDDNFGMALLSRMPFDHGEINHIGNAGVPSIVARFAINGQSLTVIGTHPLPPAGRSYAELRNLQLAALAHAVQSHERPVMVLGDLNITSWSPFFQDLLRAAGLRDSRIGFGIQPTWPTGLPHFWVPIDHCLVSEEVVVHDRRIGPSVGSDHYPVVVDFSLAAR
jgi:endonuclease/exonuclease/phosphatase (EEP) superfamily protein YafD